MCVRLWVWVSACVHASVRVCLHVSVCVWCVCLWVSVCVRVCWVCVYVCVSLSMCLREGVEVNLGVWV